MNKKIDLFIGIDSPDFNMGIHKALKKKNINVEDELFSLIKLPSEKEIDKWQALIKKESITQTRARICLLYTSPSPRDATLSRMPSSA
mgnify:CR=1 FL=1